MQSNQADHPHTRTFIKRAALAVATLTFTACFTTADQLTPEELGVTQQAIDEDAQIVISQIFVGGESTGGTYRRDYVELFNRGVVGVSLNGWTIQYGSAAGGFGGRIFLPNLTLAPGRYLLASGNGSGSSPELPITADATGSVSMSATTGKIALARTTTLLGNCDLANNPCTEWQNANIVDLVGYGIAAPAYGAVTLWEGSGPLPSLNKSTAAFRKDGGHEDTNDNAADFVVGPPMPRNTSNQYMYVRANPLGTTTCAVKNGKVICWGNNGQGQLGQGDTNAMGDADGEVAGLEPIDLGTDGAGADRLALDVTVGKTHVCALLNDMTLKCWGNGSYLGLGPPSHKGDNPGEMGNALNPLLLDGPVMFLGRAGESHTCVGVSLLTGPALKCFGLNGHAQAGKTGGGTIGDTNSEIGALNLSVATGLTNGETVTQVAGGQVHTCILTSLGKVKCWGGNSPNAGAAGQLGRGTVPIVPPRVAADENVIGDVASEMGNALIDVNLGTGRTAKRIACGNNHTCAIRDDDSLVCWGNNSNGQSGRGNNLVTPIGDADGEMGDNLVAAAFGPGKYAVDVIGGASYTCALLNDGTVRCWGLGSSAQLGQGSTSTLTAIPSTAVNIGAGRTAISIAAGFKHVCVVRDDFAIKCWGDNTNGALGIDYPIATVPPGRFIGESGGATSSEMGDAFLTPVVFP